MELICQALFGNDFFFPYSYTFYLLICFNGLKKAIAFQGESGGYFFSPLSLVADKINDYD